MTTDNSDEAIRRFRVRQENPQLEAVEARLNRKLPQSIVDLYLSPESVVGRGFDVTNPLSNNSWHVAFFNPLDLENLDPYLNERGLWPFADDGCGNSYCVPMTVERAPDGEVWFFDSDAEDSIIAKSAAEFLKWPRVPLAIE